jgi:hypothetical protein
MPTSILLRAAACLARNCNHGFFRARYPQQAMADPARNGEVFDGRTTFGARRQDVEIFDPTERGSAPRSRRELTQFQTITR